MDTIQLRPSPTSLMFNYRVTQWNNSMDWYLNPFSLFDFYQIPHLHDWEGPILRASLHTDYHITHDDQYDNEADLLYSNDSDAESNLSDW